MSLTDAKMPSLSDKHEALEKARVATEESEKEDLALESKSKKSKKKKDE